MQATDSRGSPKRVPSGPGRSALARPERGRDAALINQARADVELNRFLVAHADGVRLGESHNRMRTAWVLGAIFGACVPAILRGFGVIG